MACVTNVRRDHLDFHGSIQDYIRAKRRFFDFLAPEGLVVLNADDPVARGFGRESHRPGFDGRHLPACRGDGHGRGAAGQRTTFLLSAGD